MVGRYSDKLWVSILQQQLHQLAQCTGVAITTHRFVNKLNPLHAHHSLEGNWKHWTGYQQIEFTLECNAIMDCDPREKGNSDRLAYALNSNDITVQGKHELVYLFPRSFPNGPFYWNVYFKENPPLYPHIMNLKDAGGYHVSRFSGDIFNYPGVIDGIIDLGMVGDTSIAVQVDLLRDYLLMKHRRSFIHASEGGSSDGGFDPMLAAHYVMNFDILKNAVAPEK
jgi:hypothetical protein